MITLFSKVKKFDPKIKKITKNQNNSNGKSRVLLFTKQYNRVDLNCTIKKKNGCS